MLEYFTYKKVKKHQAGKRAETQVQTPVINEEDENFLERIISAEGTPPPLPTRPNWQTTEAGDATGNQSQLVVHDGREDIDDGQRTDKGKGKEPEKIDKKGNRMSFLQRTFTKKGRATPNEKVVTPGEAKSEEDDINKILDDLNLSAVNNRAFSMSKESQELVQKFTVILKDVVNGVPTAYDDLTHLLDGQNKTLEKSYDSLPSFLQKLITQLPNKLTSTLAPELLAVAAEAQAHAGIDVAAAGAAGGTAGLAGAAKNFMKVSSLKDLVTKPGAVVSMLKYIMNFLKLRWPAFMGTNVLLSLGLFILLFVLWYCHKRGRETRLVKETVVDSDGRIIELDDDPMLQPGPSRRNSKRERSGEGSQGDRSPRSDRGDRDDRGPRRERRHRSSDRREHEDREDRSDREERRERREREEAREHRQASRDHRHAEGSSTPARPETERKRTRRRSAEYASAGRRDDDRR